MLNIATRAKFGDKTQDNELQATADNAQGLDVKEQATSNEVSNTAKPDALNQHDTKDIPAHQAKHADLNLRPKAEIKSRRVALLMKESIYKQLKGRARSQARSVNDLVNALVEAYLSQPDA